MEDFEISAIGLGDYSFVARPKGRKKSVNIGRVDRDCNMETETTIKIVQRHLDICKKKKIYFEE